GHAAGSSLVLDQADMKHQVLVGCAVAAELLRPRGACGHCQLILSSVDERDPTPQHDSGALRALAAALVHPLSPGVEESLEDVPVFCPGTIEHAEEQHGVGVGNGIEKP